MNSQKIIALSLLFIPVIFGFSSGINASDSTITSDILLSDSLDSYDLHVSSTDSGYLEVVVVD